MEHRDENVQSTNLADTEREGKISLNLESSRQTDKVLALVKAERIRADVKFGFFRDYPDQRPIHKVPQSKNIDEATLVSVRDQNDRAPCWRTILLEEVLETFTAPTESNLAVELEQVAQVAVAWREAIMRRQDERRTAGIIQVRRLSWFQRLLFKLTGRLH